MSITKELDRISFDVENQMFEYMYETIAKELEYSDLKDIDGDNDLHEYIMNQVINRFAEYEKYDEMQNKQLINRFKDNENR